MGRGLVRGFLYVGFPGLLACGAEPDPDSAEYLREAASAGRWLQAQAGPGRPVPDRIPDSGSTGDLREGAAGRAVFFTELHLATGDSSFLASGLIEAREALEHVPDMETRGSFGLYGGLGGVGFAVAEVAKASGDRGLEDRAREVFRMISAGGEGTPPARWSDVNDVLNGTAGIGLSLLYAYEALGDSSALAAAEEAGDRLLSVGDTTESGYVRWLRGADAPIDLPNFSHGTAGVGFFLARLGTVTGRARFTRAARQAARYLDHVADTTGGLLLVPYGVPNEGYVTPHDIGWAHGPPGTARLHYALWKETGEDRYRHLVERSARTVLASGIPGPSSDSAIWRGPFGIDRRFGASGASAFLMDWGVDSGALRYLQAGLAMSDTIAGRGTSQDGAMWWTVPLYGFQGEGDGVFTGYFYGSAGLGLTLLHAYYAGRGTLPYIRLPDDPVPRRGGG